LKTLPERLTQWDESRKVVIRHAAHDDRPLVNAASPRAWIYSNGGRIAVGAVGPHWTSVRGLTGDDHAGELIDDFVFLSGQYAIRSRLVAAIGGLALAYGSVFDFRSSDLESTPIGKNYPTQGVAGVRAAYEVDHPPPRVSSSRRNGELSMWLNRLNAADPIIHRAVFQYWRAQALFNQGFNEEAVAALDGVLSVATEGVREFAGKHNSTTRAELGEALVLSREDSKHLVHMRALRSKFGAHPPLSKWWDFAEMYYEEVAEFFPLCVRVIARLVSLEEANRRIEQSPESWAAWLCANAEFLIEAVWFDLLPSGPTSQMADA